jgi:hypothetical protein
VSWAGNPKIAHESRFSRITPAIADSGTGRAAPAGDLRNPTTAPGIFYRQCAPCCRISQFRRSRCLRRECAEETSQPEQRALERRGARTKPKAPSRWRAHSRGGDVRARASTARARPAGSDRPLEGAARGRDSAARRATSTRRAGRAAADTPGRRRFRKPISAGARALRSGAAAGKATGRVASLATSRTSAKKAAQRRAPASPSRPDAQDRAPQVTRGVAASSPPNRGFMRQRCDRDRQEDRDQHGDGTMISAGPTLAR